MNTPYADNASIMPPLSRYYDAKSYRAGGSELPPRWRSDSRSLAGLLTKGNSQGSGLNGSNGSRPIHLSGQRIIPARPTGGMMVSSGPNRSVLIRPVRSIRSPLLLLAGRSPLSRSRNHFPGQPRLTLIEEPDVEPWITGLRRLCSTENRICFKYNVILFIRWGQRIPAYCLYALCYQTTPAVVSLVWRVRPIVTLRPRPMNARLS